MVRMGGSSREPSAAAGFPVTAAGLENVWRTSPTSGCFSLSALCISLKRL